MEKGMELEDIMIDEGVGFSLILYEDGDFVKTVEETY